MIITTLFLAATVAAFVHTTWYTILIAALLGSLMIGQATGKRLAKMSAALDQRTLGEEVTALFCKPCHGEFGPCTCISKCADPLCAAEDTSTNLLSGRDWAEMQAMLAQARSDDD